MQGIQVSILGVPLHQPFSQACLNSRNQLSVIRYGQAGATRDCQPMKLSDLAESARAQVAAGLPAGTLEQADAQLRRLATESLLPLCPLARAQSPPAATPTPAPTDADPRAGTRTGRRQPRFPKSRRQARRRHRPRRPSPHSPRRRPSREPTAGLRNDHAAAGAGHRHAFVAEPPQCRTAAAVLRHRDHRGGFRDRAGQPGTRRRLGAGRLRGRDFWRYSVSHTWPSDAMRRTRIRCCCRSSRCSMGWGW